MKKLLLALTGVCLCALCARASIDVLARGADVRYLTDGDTVFVFTNTVSGSSSLTILGGDENRVPFDCLVVGGGGAGGAYGGGGGGGGGVIYRTDLSGDAALEVGARYDVIVGAGATVVQAVSSSGSYDDSNVCGGISLVKKNGVNLEGFLAYGGGSGGSKGNTGTYDGYVGCTGGDSTFAASGRMASEIIEIRGFTGGNDYVEGRGDPNGGGGGGAGGPGGDATKTGGGAKGGAGFVCSITGASETYGAGGGGGMGLTGGAGGAAGGPHAGTGSSKTSSANQNAANGFGGGGGGGAAGVSLQGSTSGGSGGSGVVVFRVHTRCNIRYDWPTKADGTGVSGDLADPGTYGWQGAKPVFSPSETHFAGGGSYSAEISGTTLSIPDDAYLYNPSDCPGGAATIAARGGSRLVFQRLTLGAASPSENHPAGSVHLMVAEPSGVLEVTELLRLRGGDCFLEMSGGGMLVTTNFDMSLGGVKDGARVTVSLGDGGRWLGRAVTFGGAAAPDSASLFSRGGEMHFSGPVAYQSGDYVHSNGVLAVSGERSVTVSDNARVTFCGGRVECGAWQVGAGGSLVLSGGVAATAKSLAVASIAGRTGRAEVFGRAAETGEPSVLDVASLVVGDVGSGSLSVGDAAVVQAGSVIVGGQDSSSVTSELLVTGGVVRTPSLVLSKAVHGSRLTVAAGGVVETDGLSAAQTDVASIIFDGGTLRCGEGAGEAFVRSVPQIVCRAGGISIETVGRDVKMEADLVGSEVGAGLTKGGEGTLRYAGACSGLTAISVTGGVFRLEGGATVGGCAIRLSNGGELSLAGEAKTLSVASLTVDGGVIELDAGDILKVSGSDVSFANLQVRLGTVPELGITASLLEVDGKVSAAAAQAWKDAVLANALDPLNRAVFDSVYDSATKRTQFGVTVFKKESTVWTGTVDDDWANPGNWTKGVPTERLVAAFTDPAPAGTDVTIPDDGGEALALEFAGTDYVLSGGALALRDGSSVPCITVQSGSTGTVYAALSDGSLRKEGGGCLALGGANGALGDIQIDDGELVILSAEALGGETGIVFCRQGALAFAGEMSALLRKEIRLSSDRPFVLASARDVQLLNLTTEGGVLEKRGPGQLKVMAASGAVLPAVTVVEGTVAFAGQGDDATLDGALVNGLGEGAAAAGVRIENVMLSVADYAAGTDRSGAFGTVLEMTNATLQVAGVAVLADVSAVRGLPNRVTAVDSSIVAEGGIAVRDRLDASFVGGRLVSPDGLSVGALTSGRLLVGEGASFEVFGIRADAPMKAEFVLAFAGGGWNALAATEDIEADVAVAGGSFSVDASGGRPMRLSVAEGRRFVFSGVRLGGDGGLAVAGGGTVSFGKGMLATEPAAVLRVEDGFLDLTSTGVVVSPNIGCGQGVIRGGSFRDATLVLDSWYGGVLPRLEACGFGGVTRVTVDSPGARPAMPFVIDVAEFSGGQPDLSGWTVDFGGQATALFSMKDGRVAASVSGVGLFMIIK